MIRPTAFGEIVAELNLVGELGSCRQLDGNHSSACCRANRWQWQHRRIRRGGGVGEQIIDHCATGWDTSLADIFDLRADRYGIHDRAVWSSERESFPVVAKLKWHVELSAPRVLDRLTVSPHQQVTIGGDGVSRWDEECRSGGRSIAQSPVRKTYWGCCGIVQFQPVFAVSISGVEDERSIVG